MSTNASDASPHAVIFYDGVCNLCDWYVNLVLDLDRRDHFRFAALQSDYARRVLGRHGIEVDLDTVYVLEGGRIYDRSDASLRVARGLGFPWTIAAGWMALLPRSWRDRGYDVMARNRYRWFGKQDRCRVPSPALRAKFLDEVADAAPNDTSALPHAGRAGSA
jgi:predicted DCC family thiol-disulfide oxidoreductase YuxK